jgi:sugar lactone lactonase YvrE
MRRPLPALTVVALCALAPAAALAAPPCESVPAQRVIADGYGNLESVIVDRKGRLYFTDTDAGQLLLMRSRRAEPRVVVDGIRAPGGLAFLPDGSLLVGYGTAIPTAATGLLNPQAGLIRYDPRTGKHALYAEGLTMANGVARGPDGAIYASNDVGLGIDRVLGGEVKRAWAPIVSSNGLVVDASGRYLYAAQTFQPAAVARIEIARPSRVETWFRAALADIGAGPDGLARDEEGNLYVAANSGGEVWRIAADGKAYCSLAELPPLGPSAVAFGRGSERFERQHLYVTTFQGELIQLTAVRPAAG